MPGRYLHKTFDILLYCTANISLPDHSVRCYRNGIELPEIIAFGSLVVSAGSLIATAIIAPKGFNTIENYRKEDAAVRKAERKEDGLARMAERFFDRKDKTSDNILVGAAVVVAVALYAHR
jgi:hypothetical protein